MREKLRLFPATPKAIKERIGEIKREISKTTRGLADLDSDGDKIDDPQMYALLEEQELLRGELVRTRAHLNTDIDFITSDELGEKEEVSIGHQVRIRTILGECEEGEFTVTIGTKLDSQFLWQRGEFSGSDHLLISEDSPLAQAILGRKQGEEVTYSGVDQEIRAQILEIKVSPLVTSGD